MIEKLSGNETHLIEVVLDLGKYYIINNCEKWIGENMAEKNF